MTDTTPKKNQPRTCPKCKSPVAPGLKFCEGCGTKIEDVLVCPHCKAPLTPDLQFCETCGKSVTAAQPVPTAVSASAESATKVQEPKPTPPRNEPAPAQTEPMAVPALAESVTKVPEPKSTPPHNEPAPAQPAQVQKKPKAQQVSAPAGNFGNKKLLIAGIVGVIIIAVIAVFVVLPMLSGPDAGSTKAGSPSAGVNPFGSVFPSGTQVTQSPVTQSPAASSVVQPIQVPPVNLQVNFQPERNPITGLITLTFTGGPGLTGMRDVLFRVSRSDGEVLVETFKPEQIGSFKTLQGSKGGTGSDHVEVIANYYNGETYRIIDKIYEFRDRS